MKSEEYKKLAQLFFLVAEVGFGAKDPSFVKTCFGLFAILRSDTQNYAIFDPDFCGVWALSAPMCFFRLFFSRGYDFPSPQNRFKGPKVVRFKSHKTPTTKKEKTRYTKRCSEFLWLRRWGIFFIHCLSEEDGFGLFAIRRSDTTNYAIFDPDFCGVWVLSAAMCFFRLFFSHGYDFPSPQNRFKGPKVVRLKSLATSRKQKNKTNHKGWFRFLVAEVGFAVDN